MNIVMKAIGDLTVLINAIVNLKMQNVKLQLVYVFVVLVLWVKTVAKVSLHFKWLR